MFSTADLKMRETNKKNTEKLDTSLICCNMIKTEPVCQSAVFYTFTVNIFLIWFTENQIIDFFKLSKTKETTQTDRDDK